MARISGISNLGKTPRKHQHNYIDVFQEMVPSLYQDIDSSIYPKEDDVMEVMLGKILKAAGNIKSLFNVVYTDASTLHQHFITRNELSHLRPYIFEKKILKAFGKSFHDFKSQSEFDTFLLDTVLPNTHLNSPTLTFASGVSSLVDESVSSIVEAHHYLVNNLSWMYFLNTSGPAGTVWAPSAGVYTQIKDSLYLGKTIGTKEGIKLLFEYLWRNKGAKSWMVDYFPEPFGSLDSAVSANPNASGTLLLSGVHSLLDVWYNPKDSDDYTIDDYLKLYLDTGMYSPESIPAAPFTKFLKALSFGFYDMSQVVEDMSDLVDIEKCPPAFLQYLASLVGWKLLTGDVDRWRAQLRHATYIYKSKGTKKSLEDAMGLMFPAAQFDPLENLVEAWESYLPRMLYYLIATESKVLRNPDFSQTEADSLSTKNGAQFNFSVTNRDFNYRFAVDHILSHLHNQTDAITIGGKPFDLTTWDPKDPNFPGFWHRGAYVEIPPWENDRFYETTTFSQEQADALSFVLSGPYEDGGFAVPQSHVDSFVSFITDNTINSTLLEGFNRRWKFYTASGSNPPNLEDLISRHDSDSLSLIDFWNSKGSTVISDISLSSFEYAFEGIKMPVKEVMAVVSDIFRQFVPFHVTVKLHATSKLDDIYGASDLLDNSCFEATVSLEDGDFHMRANYEVSGFQTSATATGWVPVSHADLKRNTRRRRNFKYNMPTPSYFRNGLSMPLPRVYMSLSSAPAGNPWIHQKEYIPLGFNFSSNQYFSTSGAASSVWNPEYDIALSGVSSIVDHGTFEYWDYNRTILTEVDDVLYGIAVSSTFPCRGVHDAACAQPVPRHAYMSPFRTALLRMAIERGESLDQQVFSGEKAMQNYKFGRDTFKVYDAYNNLFGSNLSTRGFFKDTAGDTSLRLQGGGFALKDHVFGPLVFNNDFSIAGPLATGDFYDVPAMFNKPESFPQTPVVSALPDWKYIFAHNFATKDPRHLDSPQYLKADGATKIVPSYPLPLFKAFGNARPGMFQVGHTLGDGKQQASPCMHRADGNLITQTDHLVSGVSLVQTTNPAAGNPACIVYNKLAPNNAENVDSFTGKGSLSFYTWDEQYLDSNTNAVSLPYSQLVGARFPLNNKHNVLVNPDFKLARDQNLGPGSWDNTTDPNAFLGMKLFDAKRVHGTHTVGHLYAQIMRGSTGPPGLGWIETNSTSGTSAANFLIGGTSHVTTSTTSRAVLPGKTYRLALEAQTKHDYLTASAFEVTVALTGFELSSSVWTDTYTTLSSTGTFIPSSTAGYQTGTFTIPASKVTSFSPLADTTPPLRTTIDFTIPEKLETMLFSPQSKLSVTVKSLGPVSSGVYLAEYGRAALHHIGIEEISVGGQATEANILLPDKDYTLNFRIRDKDIKTGGAGTESIHVAIFSDIYPITPTRDIAEQYRPYYDWDTNTWISYPASPPNATDASWKQVFLSNLADDPYNTGWKIGTFSFHTSNSTSPFPDDPDGATYHSIDTFRGSPFHSPGTPYTIAFSKISKGEDNLTSIASNFVTLDEVWVTMESSNSTEPDHFDTVFNNYSDNDLETIYKYFDTLAQGKQSRSWQTASGVEPEGAFTLSGGSRDYYMESKGGVLLGTNVDNILVAGGKGVLYDIKDD
jgi:hypothetical protein